jgi:hypothetical protein
MIHLSTDKGAAKSARTTGEAAFVHHCNIFSRPGA